MFYRLIHKISIHINALLGFNSAWIPKKQIKKILKNKRNPVVVDIGCNVGEFSELVFDNNSNSVVHAFDLHSSLATILNKKFNRFHFYFSQTAVSNYVGSGTFESKNINDRKAFLSRNNNSKSVKINKLDNLLQKFSYSSITLIKIDTEGNDYKVLLGAEKILMITDVVIFEVMYKLICNGNLPQDAINLLRRLNFKYFYRSTKYFGLVAINEIRPHEIMTQNIVASRINLR